MTAVALDLGYDSPAAFATMFRRIVGIPPSRYRASQATARHAPGHKGAR